MTLPARSVTGTAVTELGAPDHDGPFAPRSVEPHLTALFRRYAPYVATIGMRLLGRDDDLDDLVQDVFIEACRGIRQLRSPGAVKGWLARITVRRATRRLRRLRLRAFFSLDALPDRDALADAGVTPEERAHIALTYQLLDRMPVPQRIAWILYHVEGETLDSIAELCACSKSTVQRRIRDAQRVLGRTKDDVPGPA